MWKVLLFCSLVALGASEQHRGAWRENVEYRYKVRTQTLAAIPNLKNQWTGLFTKADLTLRHVSEDKLNGKLFNVQYSEFHDSLPEGPTKYRPDNELDYKPMKTNTKPFEVRMNNGAVHSIAVDKDMTNVELNQLKSILSQLQVDIQARNAIESPRNHFPLNTDKEDNESQALYKVMEPTVTGKCETLYDISRVPLYIAQAYPEINDKMPLKKNDSVYEVIKTKDYSHCEQRMGYHFGVSGLDKWTPNTNTMGSLSKSAISRIVITGKFEEHTIRSSVTTNRVVKANPDKEAEHDSVVVSRVNVTLESMEDNDGQIMTKSEKLVDVGNLVYSYDMPSDKTNALRPKKDSSESQEDDDDVSNSFLKLDQEDNDQFQTFHVKADKKSRSARSVRNQEDETERRNKYNDFWRSEMTENFADDKNAYKQPKPTLKKAPENPMLNYFIGNKGSSIQNDGEFNAPAEVEKLAKEVAQDMEDPNEMPAKQTLRKFNVLAKIIRTMSAKQIEETTRMVKETEKNLNEEKEFAENLRMVYRDALQSAGTGPAITELMKWIEEGKLTGETAADVVTGFPKNIREPTREMQQRFFDFVKNVKDQEFVNTTAGISFTRFMFQAQVSNKTTKNYYPVESFARLTDRDSEFVAKVVVPYFARILADAVEEKDAPATLYAIRALGNLGHADVPKTFEPYLNGEVRATDFQRLAMVLAMDKYLTNYPEMARQFLTKMYQNKGETNEVRSAAVFALMRTNPPATLLQRMAEETNNEENDDVRSAVRSALESSARLTLPKYAEFAKHSKAALNLLESEKQGLQYSRTHLRDYVFSQKEASYKHQMSYIVNKDSFIPNGIFYLNMAQLGGSTRTAEFQATVSSIEELFNFFTDKFDENKSEDQSNDYDDESSKWTGEKIMKMLKMKPNKAQKLEGQILLDVMNSERFLTFDKRTMEEMARKFEGLAKKFRDGHDMTYSKLTNQGDVVIAFPLETGFPFTFTERKPTFLQVKTRVQANINPSEERDNEDRPAKELKVKTEIKAVYSVSTEVSMSFTNPNTRQRYTAGYDKKFQVYVPVRVETEFDFGKAEMKMEVKPLNGDKKTKIFQLGSWPYTTRDDAFSLRPLPQSEYTKEIVGSPVRETEYTFGEKQTGFAFTVKEKHEKESRRTKHVLEQFMKQDFSSVFMFGQDSTSPRHFSFDITLDAEKSTSKSAKFMAKYSSEKKSQGPLEENEEQRAFHPRSIGKPSEENENLAKPEFYGPNSAERRQQFLRNANKGMTANTDAYMLDATLEFTGDKRIQYLGTISGAANKAEKKSRFLAFAQKTDAEQSEEIYAQFDAKYKTADEFDQSRTETNQPRADIKFQVGYGKDKTETSAVSGEIKLKQSAEFRRTTEMESENQTGDKRRNFIDHIDVNVDFTKASKGFENELTFKTAHIYRQMRLSNFELFNVDSEFKGDERKFSFEARFSPDMRSADLKMKTPNLKAEWSKVPMPEQFERFAAASSKFNFMNEFEREALQNRDECRITGDKVFTFENRSIDNVKFGNKWHLATHKMRSSQEDQKENEFNTRFYHESVLVRDVEGQKEKKEVLIVLHQKPKKDITIRLSPTSEETKAPRLTVDDKQMELDYARTEEIRSTDDKKLLAKVFVMKRDHKDTEKFFVKVETMGGNTEVTHDGKNVQIRSKSIYRNNRGICGSFTGSKTNDLKSPENKIMRDAEDFIATWALHEGSDRPTRKMGKSASEEIGFGIPVSNDKSAKRSAKFQQFEDEEFTNDEHKKQKKERKQEKEDKKSDLKFNTKHQTQYVEDSEKSRICFSKRPLPVCAPGTRPNGKVTQDVEVYCRDINDAAAQQYKSQIRKGRNLDMSNHNANDKIKFTVPKRCERV